MDDIIKKFILYKHKVVEQIIHVDGQQNDLTMINMHLITNKLNIINPTNI